MVASRRRETENAPKARGGGIFQWPHHIQTHTHTVLVTPLHLKNDTRSEIGGEGGGGRRLRERHASGHTHTCVHMY